MTEQQSKRLNIGDRVIWNGDPHDAGTVVDCGYAAVVVTWDNGQTGTVDHRDMAIVSRAAA